MSILEKNKIPEKLTLDETWELCLAMWKWIAENYNRVLEKEVYPYKDKWLEENKITRTLEFECFFCQYNMEHYDEEEYQASDDLVCDFCPAKLVSKKFDCELYYKYSWRENPIQFYEKILKLHEKYKKSRK